MSAIHDLIMFVEGLKTSGLFTDKDGTVDKAIDNALAENADLRTRIAKLEVWLINAVELAEEGVGYTSEYFRDKWQMDMRLAVLQSLCKQETEEPK